MLDQYDVVIPLQGLFRSSSKGVAMENYLILEW